MIIKKILSHLCIICGIALLVIRVLDWFNPLMDFLGHAIFLLYVLCVSAIILGTIEIFKEDKTK